MTDGISIEWLGGNCPVQAEGMFDDVPFYFRARGSQVTCDVGKDEATIWTWRGPEYEWPDAGWISEQLATAYIHEAYEAWKHQRSPGMDARYRRMNGLENEVMHAIRFAAMLERELGDHARLAIRRLMEYAEEVDARTKKEMFREAKPEEEASPATPGEAGEAKSKTEGHPCQKGTVDDGTCYHEDGSSHPTCDCRPCAVCGGERTICAKCEMCTRCHQHAPGCQGCQGEP